MAEFLYFVEAGVARSALQPEESFALRSVLPRGAAAMGVSAEGSPTGVAGILAVEVGAVIDPERLNPKSPRIRWEEWGTLRIGGGRSAKVLAGMWEDWRPGPMDLARRSQRPGHWVMLGDGKEWLVPVLMYCTGRTGLPEELTVDASGRLEKRPRSDYRGVAERAERLARMLYQRLSDPQGSGEFFADAEGYLLVCDALGLNYRVTRAEVNLLGLLSDLPDRQPLADASFAAVDGPRLLTILGLEDEKKTAGVGNGSGS